MFSTVRCLYFLAYVVVSCCCTCSAQYSAEEFIADISDVERENNLDQKCSNVLINLLKVNQNIVEGIGKTLYSDFYKSYNKKINQEYLVCFSKMKIGDSSSDFNPDIKRLLKSYFLSNWSDIVILVNNALKKAVQIHMTSNNNKQKSAEAYINTKSVISHNKSVIIQKSKPVNLTIHHDKSEIPYRKVITIFLIAIAIIVLTTIIIVLIVYAKVKGEEEYRKKINELNKVTLNAENAFSLQVYALICEHFETLNRKKRIKLHIDDYGNLITKDWDAEFKYFFEETLAKKTSAALAFFENAKAQADYYYELYKKKYYSDAHKSLIIRRPFWIPKKLREIDTYCEIFLSTENNNKYTEIRSQFLFQDEYKLSDLKNRMFLMFAEAIFNYIDGNSGIEKENASNYLAEECSPIEFEHKICTDLSQLGFIAKVTNMVGAQVADVLAEKNGISFAIKCKLYSNSVGNNAVREAILGKSFYKTNYAVVVSNANFTKPAEHLAEKTDTILLNCAELYKLADYVN